MSPWSNEEMQATLAEVTRRATVDPEFRTLALNDSHAAFAQVNPKPLPNDFDVKFVDNSGVTKTIPLPDPVVGLTEELTDMELDAVAGGLANDATVAVKAGWSK